MCTSILNQIKLVFTWKVLHMHSFGNSGEIELKIHVGYFETASLISVM